jgi:hypothetical protein
VSDPQIQQRAADLGEIVRAEDGIQGAVMLIEESIGTR